VEFVKEFAIFLHENGAIKFGDFKLSSGKNSAYYVDLRIIPSFPHQFRKIIKSLQNIIVEKIGLDGFEYIASVPTSGLVMASALAVEIVKPLIYIRQKPKNYGTGSLIEGKMQENSRVVLIDDVGTTGQSLLYAIKSLREAKMNVDSAFVIVNRLEGAREQLESEGVKLYELINIFEISDALYKEKILDIHTLDRIKKQMA
jgi:orotate phosphoribosyltransferase